MENRLYYGDNLEVLKKHIEGESIDLVYLDPPFNSDQNYNVLFKEKNGAQSQAQFKAFEDTWSWDMESARTFQETVEEGGRIADMLNAMHGFLGNSDMMAYLAMMAPRLKELHRVLKPTGSLYLHCDPTASHYLKLILDSIFGPENFRNEVIWRRTNTHNNAGQFGRIHDAILFFVKSADEAYFATVKRPYAIKYVSSNYNHKDEKGLYSHADLTGPGVRTGDSGKPWQGYDPTARGRHWQPASSIYDQLSEDISKLPMLERLDYMLAKGFIYIPTEPGSQPRGKRYLLPDDGNPLQDIWAYQPFTEDLLYNSDEAIDEDVRWLSTGDMERLGYPTQKPEGLLERIIRSSCPPDGVVLDPFCGCGTTVSVAHRLGRTWVGIDITHLAITLIRSRLQDAFGEVKYEVKGEPTSLTDATALAKQDRFQFQWWALGKVGVRPAIQKKGADEGVDGKIYFHDEIGTSKSKLIIISVKSGGVGVKDVRDLGHVITRARDKAEIGVLITLEQPTKPMIKEAAEMGFYNSPLWNQKYPRLQILTIEEILAGKKIDSPQYKADDRVKVAPKQERERKGKQKTITDLGSSEEQSGGA